MNSSLKTRVLLLLKAVSKTDKFDLFNQAFALYKESPDKLLGMETKLNRIGFTDDGLQNLLYDLQKMHNITDTDIASVASEIEQKELDLNLAVEALNKLTTAKKKNQTKIKAAVAVVDQLTVELEEMQLMPEVEEEVAPEAPSVPGEGLQEQANAVAHKVLEHTDVVDKVPENFKMIDSEELSPLRTEFPFLNDKDCPEVMFVVVGKRISAYRRYQELHAKLQEVFEGTLVLSEVQQVELVTATQEANAENLALWDELNHYNTTGEILGKHPLFRESVAQKEVNAMTVDQLAKYRTSSATFISKKRTALKAKGLSEDKKAELLEAIADREYKLGLVNTKLGVDGNK
jgi:exonuclease VII small subunit